MFYAVILKTTCTSTLSLVNSQVYLKTHTLGLMGATLKITQSLTQLVLFK